MAKDFGVMIDQALGKDKERTRAYNKLDKFQTDFYNSIMKYSVTCVNEKAGTGKTFISVLAGLELLAQGKVSKIVYIRFPDDRSLRLGYLPGELSDKTTAYMSPFYDACIECGIMPEIVDAMIVNGYVELTTDITLRGCNISRSFVIIDESQNGYLQDLKLVLTRIHDDCKVCLLGHSGQMDNYRVSDNAFERYINHLIQKPWATSCKLPINYRGKISSWSDELV